MNTDSRIALFLTCCLSARIFLTLLAKNGSSRVRNVLAVFTLIVSIGFMYQYIYNPTKPGAFGGQPWWNKMRPVHALLYFLFALLVFLGKGDIAWIILAIDVVLGFINFSYRYFV